MDIYCVLSEGAKLPNRAHDTDAGADLFSMEKVVVPAHGSHVFDTGVAMEIPIGYFGLLASKSGLNVKHDITSEGVIDSSYRGTIMVKLYNDGDEDYTVEAGEKISQIIIIPCLLCGFRKTTELKDEIGGRNNGGFGSTGRF